MFYLQKKNKKKKKIKKKIFANYGANLHIYYVLSKKITLDV